MKFVQLIFFLLFSFVVSAQKSPIFELKNDFVSTDLVGYVSNYDETKESSIQYIFTQKDKIFKPSNGVSRFPADFQYHWVKFELKSAINQTLLLDFQQVYIDSLHCFVFSNDSLISTQKSSWRLSFLQKPNPSRFHAFKFDVEKGKNYTVFLQIHNSKIKFTSRAFLQLSTANYFQLSADFFLFQLCLSAGCLLLVSLLSLGFGVYSWRNIYFYYTGYTFAMMLYLFSANGVLNQFLSSDSVFSNPHFSSILVILVQAFHILYLYDFLRIKNYQMQWLNIVFAGFFAISMLQIITIFFAEKGIFPFGVLYLYFGFLILGSLVFALYKRQKEPFLYILATGPMFLTFVAVALAAIGFIQVKPVFFYYPNIPITLEVVGLGLALFYQFNQEQKETKAELEKNRVETTQKVLLAQEEERQKLALDLHDDLGGSLSVLNRELDDLNEKNARILTKSVNLTQKIVADLRTISHHLMPSSFEEKGLVKVVQESIEMANRQSKVYFIFVCNGEEKRQNLDTEINIYRIIKELINNVLKHSEAKQAVVQLIFFDDFLYVSIEDDGKGFDFSEQQSWGIGLNNINLRSQYLKAKITTESSSAGTLISLEIPYNANENQNLAG